MKIKRPSWDEYFLKLAQVVKTRSNCFRNQMGALIVKDQQIVTTGYNGTPRGLKNCDEGGCLRCQQREDDKLKRFEGEERCVCIHAEQNAIIQAAYHGISTYGAMMYLTVTPCLTCAKMIINAGIIKIICGGAHHDGEGMKLLKSAGIETNIIE